MVYYVDAVVSVTVMRALLFAILVWGMDEV